MSDTTITLIKYAVYMLILLGLVFLLAVLTPKIAKLFDKRKKNSGGESPSGVQEDNIKPEEYQVKGPYDKQETPEDFDPNYKIYNEDIYSFSKKKKNKKSK